MAILAFLDKMLGTTCGFDELILESFLVTDETSYPNIVSNRTKVETNLVNKLFLIRESDIH